MKIAPGQDRLLATAALLLLSAICFYAFSPALKAGFINFDDYDYIQRNPMVSGGLSLQNISLAFTSYHASNWHPLTWISHMLDVTLFGIYPPAFHLENILLHLANMLLLVLLFQRMTGRFWAAFCVGALFGLHPLRVESVAWIAERKDVLCTLFFLLTLLAYTAYARKQNPVHYTMVFFCLAFGLLAKPMLVTTPFVLLLLDYWPLRRAGAHKGPRQLFRLVLEKVPLFLLCGLASYLTWQAQQSAGAIASTTDMELRQRVLVAANAYLAYLEKSFYPANLALFYPMAPLSDARLLLCAGVLLACTILALAFGRKRPYLPVGWFWYAGMLVPVAGFVKVGGQALADRYTYLPLIGLYAALVWLISDLTQRKTGRSIPRWLPPALMVLLIPSMAWLTHAQAGLWQDCRTLYEATLSRTSDNFIIHFNLGKLLADRNEPQGALEQYEAVLDINPYYFKALNNMAWILATSPQDSVRDGDRAIALVDRAMRIAGRHNPGLMDTLAAAYAESGLYETAASVARQAAVIAEQTGQPDLAAEINAHAALFASGKTLRANK